MTTSSSGGIREVAPRALRATATAVVVLLGVVLFLVEGRVLFVLFAGILLALAFHGASEAIARWTRAPRGAILAALAVLVASAIAFGAYFLGAAIAAQASAFAEQIPRAWQSLLDAVHHRPALAQVVGPMADKAPSLPDGIAKVAMGAAGAFEAIGGIALVFFIGVYGAAQPEAYVRVVIALVPPSKRERVRHVLGEIAANLVQWLYGRAIAMAMVGVCVGVGLALMRVPLAIPLGILAGMLTFVEYLGSVASAAPAMLLAFTRAPMFAVWVAFLFTGVHIVEGYVLTPALAQRMVRIPQAYMLGTQVILGAIFGVAGLTFATPLLVVVTILVRRFYVEGTLGDKRAGSDPPSGK